jgi:hypothetical protein
MTELFARSLFYVNRPELNDKERPFGRTARAPRLRLFSAATLVIRGIYIYDVARRPSGGHVEEVTAAHEMLHVGYERLDDSEREQMVDAADSRKP